jgi:integrase
MSLATPSRKPAALPTQPTLADVLTNILADEALAPRRRQDIASALRTLAKALGRPLEELSAHPGFLRVRLKGFAPAMAGLAERRWRNTLSLTRFALKHAGLAHMPGRYREPLAPEWQALFRHLNDATKRFGLSRFAHYCTVHGVAPDRVDDQVLVRFLDDLQNAGIVNKPRKVHRTTCRLWNEAAALVPLWPKTQVVVPNYRRIYARPWSTFPASLKADVDAWIDRLAGKDILAELDFNPLKPNSLKSRARLIHEFLSALVHRGRDPNSMRSLADVVAVDIVSDGLRFFLERAGGKKTLQAHDIACVIRTVAKYWVKVPAADLEQLKKLCKRINPGRGGMTERNRARIRQFDDPQNVRALVMLPERILAEMPRSGTPTHRQALEVQTAVAIELLLMVPMRLGNLASLDVEKHLIRSRGGIVNLAIPGREVKNGVDIEAVLPPQTVRLVDAYLERYRPVVLAERSPWLFPGTGANHKTNQSVRDRIVECVKRRCGLLVNPHLFRHIAAKFYLDANPGAYGLIRLVHGHKSVETTTQYYCGMETPAAMRHFDEHILKMRAQPAPLPRKAGR